MQRTEKFRIYQSIHKSHWDGIAQQLDHWNGWGGYYRNRLRRIYQFHIPPAMNVLEIGCARGDLLASLKPIRGVGIDLSSEMIKRANQRHPNLVFMQGDIHKIELDEKFDYIILSDLINDLWDVEAVFHKIYKCQNHHPLIELLQRLGMALALRKNCVLTAHPSAKLAFGG